MTRKLVSVVTGTWQRHELLLEAIENVRAQTYRPLEHVIVSDGPDPELEDLMRMERIDEMEAEIFQGQHGTKTAPSGVPLRFVDLGRNWSSFLTNSFAAAPMLAGQLLARGEYQTWLADDERMEPDHIEALVDMLEEDDVDFAYSQTVMYWVGRPERRWIIGTDPPQCGQITNVLYRADLLKRGLYPIGAGMTSDWSCYSQWISAGARHAFLPRVTFEHRADH